MALLLAPVLAGGLYYLLSRPKPSENENVGVWRRGDDGTITWEPRFSNTLPNSAFGQLWIGIQVRIALN